MSQEEASLQEARERVRQQFLGKPNVPKLWDDLWQENITPWDRGTPNPALVDILESRKDLIGDAFVTTADGNKRRKKALVPGCGRGYDVMLFSSYGYDAVGLDGSETAIAECKKMAAKEGAKYPTQVAEGHGSVEFVLGDFFAEDWATKLEFFCFDAIYDYTFLCALSPSMRPKWALQMVNLLAPAGRLICLEFPTTKPPSAGGPPWALPPEVYEQHLSWPGEDLKYTEDQVIQDNDRQKSEKALVRLAHWMPERTFEVGKGTDWVSVWGHRVSS